MKVPRSFAVIFVLLLVLAWLTLLPMMFANRDALAQGGPTNFGGVHLNCTECGTATPVLLVNRDTLSDPGVVAEFQYRQTPIASMSSGALSASKFLQETIQTTQTITNGSVLTPTGSYQPLSSTVAATITLSSGCVTGNLLTLVNVAAQTIVVSETTTFIGSGNASLGQDDTVLAVCNGTGYVQLAESDN